MFVMLPHIFFCFLQFSFRYFYGFSSYFRTVAYSICLWLQRPQLVKGSMQLFSVDQQRSQALEAHAASFATFKVIAVSLLFSCVAVVSMCYLYVLIHSVFDLCASLIQVAGNENPSILICFASKTMNAGQITSKLHVIELGAQPGSESILVYNSVMDFHLFVALILSNCSIFDEIFFSLFFPFFTAK